VKRSSIITALNISAAPRDPLPPPPDARRHCLARHRLRRDGGGVGGDVVSAVVFLDMDGVLSTRRAYSAAMEAEKNGLMVRPVPDRWIDADAMTNFNDLIERSGALVVVSSTWRLDHHHTDGSKFLDILRRNGFVGTLHNDWRTKDLSHPIAGSVIIQGKMRGDEVLEWLSRHPDITRYAILDDDCDFHPTQPHVKSGFEIGLTAEHVELALMFLEDES
jgi:HAD domain in Swiss Army Knife RNA repair proteins